MFFLQTSRKCATKIGIENKNNSTKNESKTKKKKTVGKRVAYLDAIQLFESN